MSKHINTMQRHPVIAFYVLAFAFSWLGWVPQALHGRGLSSFDNPTLNILGGLGPTFAALAVIFIIREKGGVRQLFGALFKVRASIKWYAFAFGFWVLVATLALGLGAIFGKPFPAVGRFGWASLLPAFAAMVFSNAWEEIGWRGFALPRLQKKHSNLKITFIMGLLWSLWHLPLMLNPASSMANLPWYGEVAFNISLSAIYIWLFERTQHSLFFVSVFHAMSNTVALGLLELGVYESSYPFVVGVTAVVGIAIALVSGWRWVGQVPPVAQGEALQEALR